MTAFIAKPEGVTVLEKKRQLLAARAAAEKVREYIYIYLKNGGK